MDDIFTFTTARGTARANLTATWLDDGTVETYGGTRPATSDTAVTDQPLLVIFDLPSPAGDVSNAVFTGDTIPPALILATGNATWARVKDSAGVAIGDCDAGVTGSGAMLELSNTALVAGAYATATSFTLTEG
jgi:hypothetical protein